jgi:hypothetical protein
LYGADVSIEETDLPYTFGAGAGGSDANWDTIQVAGSENGRINADGHGILPRVDRLIIDFAGADNIPGNADDDSLIWGIEPDSGTGINALFINGNYVDSLIIIRGGYWIHAPSNFVDSVAQGQIWYTDWRPLDDDGVGADDEDNMSAIAFALGGQFVRDVWLDSVAQITVTGYKGITVQIALGRTKVRSSRIFCHSFGFGNRSNFEAYGIGHHKFDTALIYGISSDSDFANLIMENSYVYSNGMAAFYSNDNVAGQPGIARLVNDTIIGDVRNHADTSGSDPYWSTTNAYALYLQGCGAGSIFDGNVIKADSVYKGIRAAHIYVADGDADNWNLFINNTIYAHDGFSTQYPTAHATAAIKIRGGATYWKLYGNIITTMLDTFHSGNSGGLVYDGDTVAFCNRGECIALQNNTFNNPGTDHPWNIQIYNNVLTTDLRSDDATGYYEYNAAYLFDNQKEEDASVLIYGNKVYYHSTYATYGHPGFDGPGAFITISNDTLYRQTDVLAVDTTLAFNNPNTDSCTENYLIDLHYESGYYAGVETDIFHEDAATDLQNVYLQRNLDIYVNGSLNDLPVVNATDIMGKYNQ